MGLGRAARRLWRGVNRLAGRRHLTCVYATGYQVDLGGVPFDPQRGERVLRFLLAEGLVGAADVVAPEPAALRDLLLVHGEAYLASLHAADAFVPIVGYPVPADLRERALAAQRHQVGGTVAAALAAASARRVVATLGGGLHHAGPDAGAGFCIYNDVAVAVARLRESGFDGRILVVDLDLHDGNGTRACFAADETVFTFSIHNRDWDTAPAVASLSVTLDGAVGDDRFLAALEAELPPVVDSFRPRLVFYLAGVDTAADDELGDWELSAAGIVERDRFVLGQFGGRRPRLPVAVTLAGGYGSEAWRYTARSLAWVAAGTPVEPPSTEEITLLGYRERVGGLAGIGAPAAPAAGAADWALTEEDVYGHLGAAGRPRRFLGRYTPQAIELILETSGLLERVRALGFAQLSLDLDLDNPTGETLRLFSGPDRGELLMELRVRRERHAASGFEFLRLEWLLLQNPRARFEAGRQPLPGQAHPGLGLLNDVIALLILLAERLELDGILFVPSHYHLATKGRGYLRFRDAEDDGWVAAVDRAVAALPLAEATRAVAAGRVVDRRTGEPVAWRPMPMIIPTSERFRRQTASRGYQDAVEAESRRHDFALAGEAPAHRPSTAG